MKAYNILIYIVSFPFFFPLEPNIKGGTASTQLIKIKIKKLNWINKNRIESKYFNSVFDTQFIRIKKNEKIIIPNRNIKCPPLVQV